MATPTPESLRRVQLLRPNTIAKFIVGETPSPQIRETYEKDQIVEVSEGVAKSMVRAKIAKFVSPKEQESFLADEQLRLDSGRFINDSERDAQVRKTGIPIVQLAG